MEMASRGVTAGSAAATITPSRIRMMRSVARPTARSCVTISSESPRSRLSRRSSAVISAAF